MLQQLQQSAGGAVAVVDQLAQTLHFPHGVVGEFAPLLEVIGEPVAFGLQAPPLSTLFGEVATFRPPALYIRPCFALVSPRFGHRRTLTFISCFPRAL